MIVFNSIWLGALLIVAGMIAIAAGVEFWIDGRRARGLEAIPGWLLELLRAARPVLVLVLVCVLAALAIAPLWLVLRFDQPALLLLWIPVAALLLGIAAAY
jgi:hypothetical protein